MINRKNVEGDNALLALVMEKQNSSHEVESENVLDYAKMSKFDYSLPHHVLDYSKMKNDHGKGPTKMRPSDERKIETLKAELSKAPLLHKKLIQKKIDLIMTRYESKGAVGDISEGGPGSGGGETRPIKMPMSPYVSVGTRKGIIQNMPFEEGEIEMKSITHAGQKSYVPAKMKNLVKNPDVITNKPVSLLHIPSENAYHVMDGHHRYLAALKLGLEKIPAKIWVKHEIIKPSDEINTIPPASEPTVNVATTELSPENEPVKIEAEAETETAPECSCSGVCECAVKEEEPEVMQVSEPAPIETSPAVEPAFISELDAIDPEIMQAMESISKRLR